MYAIIVTGGKQYKVEKGSILNFEKIDKKVGSKVEFDKVLLACDGSKIDVGFPILDGVIVRGRILNNVKNKKIIVFKYKKRKGYARKYGHRQSYTSVIIEEIKFIS